MSGLRCAGLTCLAWLIASPVALAASAERRPPSTATTYPLSAALVVPRPLALGADARSAFETEVRALFREPAQGAAPDLVLELTMDAADVQSGQLELPIAVVFATVTVATAAGSKLDSLRPQGNATVRFRDDLGVREALRRALLDCARDLPRLFANSEPIVRWLQQQKIQPMGSFITGPARGILVGYLDVTAGAVSGANGPGLSFGAKAGIEWKWLLLRVVLQSFNVPWGGGSGIDSTAFGVELGPVLRFSRGWELGGGVGLHRVWGTIDTSQTFVDGVPHVDSVHYSRTLPAVSLSVQYALWPGWRFASRVRFGLEVRRYFDYDQPVDQIHEVVPLADTSIGFTVGIEVPFIPDRASP